ncbi:MAG: CRISPR-associated endonuclease Cas2 [Candidatus Kuenenbacteria bacterium]
MMTKKTRKAFSLASKLLLIMDEAVECSYDWMSIRRYFMREARMEYRHKKLEIIEMKKIAKRYYNTLQYLRKAELITQNQDGNYDLSQKGKGRILNMRAARYQKKKGRKKLKHLVVFDIPESERRKRTLLRQCLYNLCYDKVQKSCFISDDLAAYDLVCNIIENSGLQEYVEIFVVK